MSVNWEHIGNGNGTRIYLGSGEDADSVLVKHEFDPNHTAAILERNKALQNEAVDRRSEMRHVASIPPSVMFKWYTEHGISAWNPHHMDAVKKLLNSNEYRYLKCKDVII